MKKTIITILLTAVSLNVWSGTELKGAPNELRQFLHPRGSIVSLYAEAEKKAYSDKATISLIVTTEDHKLSTALSQNSQLRQDIRQQLIKFGLKGVHIKNSRFSTSPQFGWFGEKPKSYKIINRMAIDITQEAQLQKIASIADENEEVSFSGTTFEHTQKEQFTNQVKQQALSKVIEQKNFYEEMLDITLTPIRFRDARLQHRATRGALTLERTLYSKQAKTAKLTEQNAPQRNQKSPLSTPDSFDEVKYQAGIYVDFKVHERTSKTTPSP